MTLKFIDDVLDADRIRGQMPAYLAEMTAYLPDEEQEEKPLTYPYLEHYWREDDRSAFVIHDEQKDLGFVLVRFVRSGTAAPDYHSIAEFYVQPEVRRTGIGKVSVAEAIARFDGKWLIQVLERNTAAMRFWRTVLEEITGSDIEPEFDGKFFNFWLYT